MNCRLIGITQATSASPASTKKWLRSTRTLAPCGRLRVGEYRFPVACGALRILFALILALAPSHAFSTITRGSQITLSKPLVVKWRFETEAILNLTPAIYKDSVYLPLLAGNVVSLDLHDGEIEWRAEVGGEISASPAADQRAVYVASEHDSPS